MRQVAQWKQRDRGKAFYALRTDLEPNDHGQEFDVRLWLTLLERATSAAD